MIPTLVRNAFRVAEEERPGPVHLELPEDIAGEEVRREAWSRRIRRAARRRPERLDRAAEMIAGASVR